MLPNKKAKPSALPSAMHHATGDKDPHRSGNLMKSELTSDRTPSVETTLQSARPAGTRKCSAHTMNKVSGGRHRPMRSKTILRKDHPRTPRAARQAETANQNIGNDAIQPGSTRLFQGWRRRLADPHQRHACWNMSNYKCSELGISSGKRLPLDEKNGLSVVTGQAALSCLLQDRRFSPARPATCRLPAVRFSVPCR
jgi:hypothetical protein